jgi:murein DD-endopeptidase MepM/ murein hydrolase activator NlpD
MLKQFIAFLCIFVSSSLLAATPKNTIIDQANLLWPVSGVINSEFGMRGKRMHKGIDIYTKSGTPIHAAASGTVTFSGRLKGYGMVVILEHDTFVTLYAHCSRLLVMLGDAVDAWQEIALVGHTGNARGSHLHFETQTLDGTAINPMPFFRRDAFSLSAILASAPFDSELTM